MILALIMPLTAKAETLIPDEVFITEAESGTCTLASTAMMIRARMYLSGSEDWWQITDYGIRGTAWKSGSGLYYNFTLNLSDNEYVTISHFDVNGVNAEDLKAMLDDHPEGIVLHCTGLLHALHVTDYEGDEFFCADPKYNFDGINKRINIMDSLVGGYHGSLEGVLGSAIGVWYVSDYNIASDKPEIDLPVLISDEEIREVK